MPTMAPSPNKKWLSKQQQARVIAWREQLSETVRTDGPRTALDRAAEIIARLERLLYQAKRKTTGLGRK